MATVYKSVGVKAQYATGTVSLDATKLIVTLSGGTFDADWGLGDKFVADVDGTPETGYVLSRDSSTQLTLQIALATQHSGEDFSIDRSYSSLSAWESGEQKDLVTATEINKAVCYDDWAGGLVNTCSVTGWTSNATYYPEITVAEGHRHDGTSYDTGFYLNPGHNYGIYLRQLGARISHVGFKITGISVSNGIYAVGVANMGVSAPCIVSNCIANDTLGYSQLGCFYANYVSANGHAGVVFNNCTAITRGARQGFWFDIQGTANNCTAIGNGSTGDGFDSVNNSSRQGLVKNCVAYGFTVAYDANTGAAGSTNNASDIAETTSPPGASPFLTNITADDFHDINSEIALLSGKSKLRGEGADLSGSFTDDIRGKTRAGSFDIGSSQFVTIARSVGSKSQYLTGTIAIDSTGYIVTLTTGTFDTEWGRGDKLVIDTGGTPETRYVLTRDSGTQLTLQTASTKTSQSSLAYTIDKTYSSLSAYEAGEQADLTANNDISEASLYKMVDTTQVAFVGWTTSNNNYYYLNAIDRHLGYLDSAGTNSYVLNVPTSNYVMSHGSYDYIIDGIQIDSPGAGAYKANAISTGGGSGTKKHILNSIIADTGPSTQTAGTPYGILDSSGSSFDVFIINCIFQGWRADDNNGQGVNIYSANDTIYNCTFIDCYEGYHAQSASGTENLINCSFQWCDFATVGTLSGTVSNNQWGEGTPPGTSGQEGLAVFVDADRDRFAVDHTDTKLRDNGTDLSGDATYAVTTDIIGNARDGSTPTIGAFEAGTVITRYWRIGADAGGTGVNDTDSGGGHAYQTLLALLTAEATNLKTSNQILHAITTVGGVEAGASASFSGFTSGNGNYVIIEGQSAGHHQGLSREKSGTGYQYKRTGAPIIANTPYHRIKGLEFTTSGGGYSAYGISTYPALTSDVRLEQMICSIDNAGDTSVYCVDGSATTHFRMTNCLLLADGHRGMDLRGSTSIIDALSIVSDYNYAIMVDSGVTITNTWATAVNRIEDWYQEVGSGSHCGSVDGTAPNTNEITIVTANDFTSFSADPATADLTLKSGSSCIDAGTGSLATDITGGARTGTMDVGAFNYVIAPSITSLDVITGTTAGGTTVVITGTGFLAAQGVGGVTFDGDAASIVAWGDLEITLTTPAHAAGAVDVVVTNNNSLSDTDVGGFTYITPTPAGGGDNDSNIVLGIGIGL